MLLQKQSMSEALFRGIVGHAGLDVYYTLLKEGVKDYPTILAQVQFRMMDVANSLDCFNKEVVQMKTFQLIFWFLEYCHPRIQDWEILAVEREYRIQIPGTDYTIPFVVDLIAKTPYDGIVAFDNKFVYDFVNSDNADLLPQLPKYYGALKLMGAPIDSVGYIELRYRDTKDNKADPAERFRITTKSLTPKRVITTMDEQMRVARRIARYKEMQLSDWESEVVRSADTMNCNYCPFSDLCENDLNGRDTSEIVRVNYKKKERRSDESITRTSEATYGSPAFSVGTTLDRDNGSNKQ